MGLDCATPADGVRKPLMAEPRRVACPSRRILREEASARRYKDRRMYVQAADVRKYGAPAACEACWRVSDRGQHAWNGVKEEQTQKERMVECSTGEDMNSRLKEWLPSSSVIDTNPR